MGTPSASSPHLPWADTPITVQRWAASLVGPITEAMPRAGGMSPGPAVVLRGRDGAVFVKAVGADLNPRTPALYRHEAEVLAGLPDVPYRPGLRGVFDDGSWVAIALDPVDGAHPDLTRESHLDAVRTTLAMQAAELRNHRPPMQTLAELAAIWLEAWSSEQGLACMPAWLRARQPEFAERLASLPERLPPDQLIHWDARDDNLLVRPDGSVVIFDWGMSRLGPVWADLFLLALRHAERPAFDGEVAQIPKFVGSGPDKNLVDDFLVLFGVRLAYMAEHRPEIGIPAITYFRRRQSAQLLEGARRRLGAGRPQA